MKFTELIMRYILVLIFGVALSFSSYSQDGKLSKADVKEVYRKAVQFMELGDYNKSFEQFVILLRNNPQNAKLNYEAGIVLFEGSFDKSKSIPLFVNAMKYSQGGGTLSDLYYYLGRAYHYDQNYLFAIASYNTFLAQASEQKIPKSVVKEVEEYIDQCEKGKELVDANKDALNKVDRRYRDITKFYTNGNNYVKLINLGKYVNSEYSEYGPILLENDNFLLFTSRKEGSTGGEKYFDGQYFEDIYLAEKGGEVFGKVKNLNEVPKFQNSLQNTPEHEATVSANASEDLLFFYQGNQISQITLENSAWTPPTALTGSFDKPGNYVTSALISPDEKSLVLVSDRQDSYGGRDLYMVNKKSDGTWGEMKNMGKTLNTNKDEASPYFSNDTTLYFSSKGHSSIGGYDVFVSYYRKGEWSKPKNLDIPINTAYDEINYIVSKDGKFAVYASNRTETYGEYDIFFITKGYDEEIDPILLAQFAEKEQNDEKSPKTLEEIIASVNETDKGKDPTEDQLAVVSENTSNIEEQSETETPEIAVAETPTEEATEPAKTIDEGKEVAIAETAESKDIDPETEVSETSKALTKSKLPAKETAKTTTPEKATPSKTTKPAEEDTKSVLLFSDIQFEFNSTQLNEATKNKLDEAVAKLKKDENLYATIIGHADSVGSKQANMNVSRLRALRAYNYILAKGIEANRLDYTFKGEDEPIASNETEAGRTQNRRIEVSFFKAQFQAFIQFGFDEKVPVGDELAKVKQAIPEIKKNPNATVYLSGHTDPYGSKKYNQLLSQWRVEAVEKVLKENGLTNKIEKAYFGEDEPRYSNSLAETRKLNRRVQLVLY